MNAIKVVVISLALGALGCEPDASDEAGVATVQTSVVPGSYEAEGILWVANEHDQETLDDVVRLDARAARNIVATRAANGRFETVEALDAVAYVGPTALERMLEYAVANGQVGDCGDGVINGAEACDGGEGCTPECVLAPADVPDATVYGIQEHSYVALGILAVANRASLAVLDDDVGLDARAARAIVADRPIQSLTELDERAYVGRAAFGRLRDWAEATGAVPFCGDGVLQPLVEHCDDGNSVNGDGCPGHCGVGEDASGFLMAHDDVIRGDAIDSQFVRADRFYLRARPVTDHRVSEAMQSVFQRADGIIANLPADGWVDLPELVRLSQPGFYESLLDDEQAALPEAWRLFEVSHAPIVDHQYGRNEIDRGYPFEVFVERPGPLVIPVFELDQCWHAPCDRVQRLPGCDADGDATTVHLEDVERALDEFRPVFTPGEVDALERLTQRFIDAAAPEELGEFRIEFTDGVEDRRSDTVIAQFDGYSYRCTATARLRYDAESDFGWAFDQRCWFAQPTGGDIRFRSLRGGTVRAYHDPGVWLLEHWQGGERIYNRLVRITINEGWRLHRDESFDDYASALPFLTDGTALESYAASAPEGSRGLRARRGSMTRVPPPFADRLVDEVQVGRHEPFHDVVVDVHGDYQVFAYLEGCELHLQRAGPDALHGYCEARDTSVTIQFGWDEITLQVWDTRGRHQIRMDEGAAGRLRLDRTFLQR